MPAATGSPGPRPAPSREAIALLEPFERIGLDRVVLVSSAAQADRALARLSGCAVLGFDTESRPTFARHEVSGGPHVVQLCTDEQAFVFQLQDRGCSVRVAELLAMESVLKVGFGLGDDRRRIVSRLGVEPRGVLDLNHLFQDRGYRKDMGVRAAVALLFERRFIKSRKATTSNWAQPQLTEAQLLYAANDAYAALRVFQALQAAAPG